MTRRICSLARIAITCIAASSCAVAVSCAHHTPRRTPPKAKTVKKRGPTPRALARRKKAQKPWTCARVKQARAAAFADANARLAKASIKSKYSIDAKAVGRARAAGLDAARIERLLVGAFAKRLHAGACPKKTPKKKLSRIDRMFANRRFAKRDDTKVVDMLLALLGKVGRKASLGLLWRLSEIGYWNADYAREAILETMMKRAIAHAKCQPPSAAEVAGERAKLAGFAVIERVHGALSARKPSARELDDLAYLMAASSARGPAVGTWPERGKGNWMRRAKKPSATRREWAQKIKGAKAKGDVQQIAFAARRYLASLGYPKGIRTTKVHDYSWAARTTRT